jgi:DNA-binding transcriptional MocR family regulator
MFELSRESPVALVDQICARVTQLVRSGRLPPGTRLPSIRKLARQVSASPFTVVDAYDRLVAIEGSDTDGSDALSLTQLCLAQCSDIVPAGSGFLPENWLLDGACASVLRRLQRRGSQPWLPCPTQGLPQLREQVAARLVQQGVAAGAANIMTTYGASQAFDLLARLLLAAGDAVLVEDPGYFVLFEQLRAHHVRLIPVPRLAEGPDLEALEAACRAHRPRAFFMQTLVHNPTGWSAEAAHCHRILSLAERYGFVVVEDDVYGDLYEGSAVRLAQIDGLRHVVYVGSYTKLIGPALRVGFVAADAALTARLTERKVLSVLAGSALLECFVAEMLDGGRYKRHVEQLRARLARMRRAARSALESTGIEFPGASGEGMFLWGRVPDAAPVDELVRRARAQSILLARGALFSADGGCGQWLRFNVTHSTSPPLIEFLRGALRAA